MRLCDRVDSYGKADFLAFLPDMVMMPRNDQL